jgi:hypothetical protein
MVGAQVTNDEHRCHWARDFLPYIARAQTARNITTLVAWAIAEGGWWDNKATFNPLNTTQKFTDSHPINSVGVQAYRSELDGFHATATTLHNGNYPGILDGLAKNLTPMAMSSVIGRTPWGTPGLLIAQCVPRASRAVALAFP